MKAQKGFTIVELLIVIVVIAILAAITIVSYNGIQDRANRSIRTQDLSNLIKSFNAYKANYGTYPVAADGGYCVGQGFEDTSGDGVGDCRNTDVASWRHSYSEDLTNELAKVLPYVPSQPTRAHPDNEHVGPLVVYSANDIRIYNFFKGTDPCPLDLYKWWTDSEGEVSMCEAVLEK